MIKEADIKASKIYKLYQLFNADLRVLVEQTKPAIWQHFGQQIAIFAALAPA